MWIIFSVLASLGLAAMPVLTKYFNAPTVPTLFVLKGLFLLSSLPFFFIATLEQEMSFYVGGLVAGLLFGIGDIYFFNAIKRHGAGVCSRLFGPLLMLTVFLAWFLVDMDQVYIYIDNPLKGIIVFGSIAFIFIMALWMRKCRVSTQAIFDLLPNLVLATVAILIIKSILTVASLDVSFQLLGLTAIGGLVSLCVYAAMKKLPIGTMLRDRKTIIAGSVIGVTAIEFNIFKFMAMATAFNPGLVEAILLLCPFWILLYNRLFKIPDGAKILPGLGMVLAAIILSIWSTG